MGVSAQVCSNVESICQLSCEPTKLLDLNLIVKVGATR